MAQISLYLDEDMHLDLGSALRKRGFDAVHAQEAGRKEFSDSDQLTFAVEQERCFFSFNTKDFAILHNEYAQTGKEHWGIIVSKQRPLGETIRRLLQLLRRHSRDSIRNRIEFL